MFLFTDRVAAPAARTAPAAALPPAGLPHAAALRQAAAATGVSFDYLARTAERESNFNAAAKAPTSSATGMFQFLEQTWLGMVKQEGPRHGLSDEAAAITGSGGRWSVADRAMRQRILALREDPMAAAAMAGAFARANGRQLEEGLGRRPAEGELYIAHFLGAAGARELIQLAQSEPDAKAAGRFPDAAAANRSVFFDRAGRARSAAEVYASLTGAFGQAEAAPASAATTAQALAMFRVREGGKPLHGLFRSQGEPVAPAVADAWSRLPRRKEAADGATRVAFFPSEAARATASDAPSLSPLSRPNDELPAERRSFDGPLPPARPAGIDGATAPSRRRNGPEPARPLDLMRFMRMGASA